jgi:hypothetical protein
VWRHRWLGTNQRVGHPQLDEGLTRDADAPGFSIDRPQQVDGEVDVDPLDFAARTTGLRSIDIGRHVAGGIIDWEVGQAVEFLSGDQLRLILLRTALFRPRVRGGPR